MRMTGESEAPKSCPIIIIIVIIITIIIIIISDVLFLSH